MTVTGILLGQKLKGNDAVCDQKISKFFVSHVEESMAGHIGINDVY
jgi:hypothetical protein